MNWDSWNAARADLVSRYEDVASEFRDYQRATERLARQRDAIIVEMHEHRMSHREIATATGVRPARIQQLIEAGRRSTR